MRTLQLVGWSKGVKTVSLVEAVKDYSTGSLVEAKRLVEQLLDGHDITLAFPDDDSMSAFRRIASELGVQVE